MAIQFPNFLAAQLVNPDYSGIGDIVSNYYAGKAMPKDDLIKRIQAEFARPTAEQSLISSRLGNEKSRLDIQKLRRELQDQANFDAEFKRALSGGVIPPNMPAGMPSQSMTNQQPAFQQPSRGMTYQNDPMEAISKINPALAQALQYSMQSGGGVGGGGGGGEQPLFNPAGMTPIPSAMSQPQESVQPQGGEQMQMNQFQMPSAANSGVKELVLEQGDPRLAAIDAMWENNPRARDYLKKKGYEKVVKNERDKKTGAELVYTKYPSGKIIKRMVMPEVNQSDLEGDIPLTKPVLNAAVKQVRGTDAVIPYIDQILEMGGVKLDKNGDPITDKKGKLIIENDQLPNIAHGILAFGDANSAYDRIVNNALEKYMAASGFNQTDMSTQKVEKIMNRGWWESKEAYLKQMAKERKEMLKGREQNVRMITKGLRKYPDFGADSGQPQYSSDEWEQTNGST